MLKVWVIKRKDFWLKVRLYKKNVKITKIATGIPIGTDMEYIDAMTLEMSLEERKEFS